MSLDAYLTDPDGTAVYWANITHNLAGMADELGLYSWLWHPNMGEGVTASRLIDPLRSALGEMVAEPERFRSFDAPNGWGTYDDFLPWLHRLLVACEASPNALFTSHG